MKIPSLFDLILVFVPNVSSVKSLPQFSGIDSDRAVSNTVMGDACLINSTRILDKQTRTWEFAVKAQATLSILCSIHPIFEDGH